MQGGSTITQQFVKNAYLTSQKTIGRKLVEAALAWQLEQKWTKDQILTAYLNTVYFGNGAYGVEQASRIYFHHSADDDEAGRGGAARGHPRGPEPVGPGRAPAAAAKARRNLVLRQLYAAGLPDAQPVRELARLPRCRTRRGVVAAVDAGRRRRRTSRTT